MCIQMQFLCMYLCVDSLDERELVSSLFVLTAVQRLCWTDVPGQD